MSDDANETYSPIDELLQRLSNAIDETATEIFDYVANMAKGFEAAVFLKIRDKAHELFDPDDEDEKELCQQFLMTLSRVYNTLDPDNDWDLDIG